MATIAGCEDCVASACRRFVRLRSGFVRPLFVVSPCGRRRVCGGARGAEEVNEGMNQHQQHNASDCSDGNEAGSVNEMPSALRRLLCEHFMPLMQPFRHIFLELLLVRLVLVPAALATSAGVHARSLSRLDGRRGGCRADIGKQR